MVPLTSRRRTSTRSILLGLLLASTASGGPFPLEAQDAAAILYRVNAGGPALSGTPTWSADTSASPSPHLGAGGAGTATYGTSATIDMTHPSLPPGLPPALLQAERYDDGSAGEMKWSFPVTPGMYEVRLYFAEIWFTSPGQRVFGVTIEGSSVLQNYDVVADVGPMRGVAKTFLVSADSTLDVHFTRTVENPKVAAIEIVATGATQPPPAATWQTLAPAGTARHEISYVHHNGKFYLNGDRGYLLHEVYDPATDTWTTTTPLPREFHHAQGVELNGSIYYLGGLAGPFPDHVIADVHVFNPATGAWTQGTPMPAARARGGGGTAPYNGKLYVAGGLQDAAKGTGHDGVSVNLFDVYDPASGTWTQLPNMPRARDHFHAAVVGNRLYAIGGRQGGVPDYLNAVIPQVDVFDLTAGTWSTLAPASNLPTPRAGVGVAVIGQEIVVIGGEGNGKAWNTVEALDTTTGKWRTLPPMPTARHGIQAAVCNNGIYIAGGGLAQGGDVLTDAHEALFLGTPGPCGSAQPPPSGAGYRVNAGGPALATSPSWSGDTAAAPSPYVNASASASGVYTSPSNVTVTHPSIPAGTPAEIFKSERWDPADGAEMQWSFPVTPGTYQVRLYFAEVWFTSPGERVFDVSVEGSLLLDNYDVVADVGAFNGVVKSFLVTANSTLDVSFQRVVENPKVSAIEILPATAAPGQIGASPASVSFGTIGVGQTATRTVSLTNLGGAGDPAVVISETNLTGTDAGQFTDSFDDAATVSLAPGQSTTVTVRFVPTSTGSKSATLQIVHSGTNSPLNVPLQGSASTSQPIGFGKSVVAGTVFDDALDYPTSLQFGPDGRLYVGHQNGLIRVYTVQRTASNAYSVVSMETITSINSVPNHDDDGAPNPSVNTRLITGLLVAGTAANPVIYVAHSDPRIGGGPEGQDLNLDTNSSMISRLTWTGSGWQHLNLVRGLPRSEENHAANGMQLDPVKNVLYVAMGGNTNKGAPSFNFAFLPEFALSAAILSIDLNAIGNTTYDLPTLDDEARPGNPDLRDPFGGSGGKNQAVIVPGGPVQVYAPGFRNPYDLVITESGRMYTIDNGGNAGWGDMPIGAGPGGKCTNEPNEVGTTSPDGLHFVSGPGYYGGHPNPTRGNRANTFNATNPQSPVPVANPVECEYREAGPASGALAVFAESTNGLTEYSAGNFGGAMKGDLILASFDGNVHRVQLDATGAKAVSAGPLFSAVGMLPLDVTALGEDSPFPGTIWVGLYGTGEIVVFEPNDYDGGSTSCSGAPDPDLDEDNDGYSNKDEVENGTSPCSAADLPVDADKDFISDLNDPDDDNDGVADEMDPFPLDPANGLATRLPVSYLWENDGTKPGGILNLGFTGLMINGVSNYRTLYKTDQMTAGGAAGVVTVDKVTEGDAFGALNNQEYGFQFGVWARPADTGPFFVHTRILGPFSGLTPADGQSMGLFVGTGDQDNYAKIVVSGGGQIAFHTEIGGAVGPLSVAPVTLPGPSSIDLYLRVDPAAGTVQPYYSVTSGGVTSPRTALAGPHAVPASWFTNPAAGLALGIISTSRGPGPEFPATWDFILATPDTPTGGGGSVVYRVNAGGGSVAATPNWSADTATQPSPYVNAGTIGNNVYTTPSAVGSNHPSIPAGTPSAVFSSERWNPAASAPMQWSFPVTPGSYEVRLYFAELWYTTAGARAFDASIEGVKVLTAYDIVAEVGAFTGVMKSFTVTADSTLDVAFGAVVENPKVNAIEIVSAGTGDTPAGQLSASPQSLSFGNVAVGQTSRLAVQLTNVGTAAVVVQSAAISGSQASQFTHDLKESVTLAPGASAAITVTFAPTSNGNKTATLSITHSGVNSPLEVPLSGAGRRR